MAKRRRERGKERERGGARATQRYEIRDWKWLPLREEGSLEFALWERGWKWNELKKEGR